jgi:hypothetical protein
MAEGDQGGTSLATEASQGAAGNGAATDSGNQTQTETQAPEWVTKLEGLDDKERGRLSRFKSEKELAKSYLNAESKLGASVVIPGKDASKTELDAFYKRLGRPESKGEYELEAVFLPDGITKDDKTDEAFRTMAHELGLTKDQAKKLHKYAAQQGLDAYASLRKQVDAKKEETRAALRKEWGADHDRNLAQIGTLLRKFGSDEVIQYMNSGPGNDPPMLRLLAKLAGSMSADRLETGTRLNPQGEADGSDQFPNSPGMTGSNRSRRIQ